MERASVLAVDDEPQNLELLEAYLIRECDVIFASNGEEALQKVQDENIDLILLDIMMPGMDGYEVCQKIKENEDNPYIPIIMITALSEKDDLIKGLESGAEEFLTKPVNKLELQTRVRSFLKLKRYHDEILRDRNKLEIQNQVREILTAIIPSLLATVPVEQKKVVMRQMLDMVEKNILHRYHEENNVINADNIGEIGCEILSEIGGNYYTEKIDGNFVRLQAHKCPWGDEAKINPIMCNLTAGILSRLLSRSNIEGDIKVRQTLGNRDEKCCLDLCFGK
ncbi:CheY-like chemotaxis protein [Methanohalophilus levihalophilus]|uniref:methanogen output domain 1-containing protein n=1 Tax=Methanohalophilus levihalophilus TaxID=1431282 RepID=UPI001AE439EE|nr:methanogen output domain 1-containing protein [Methanohalophilus levihalophilus]MBP2029552.1 CheY-like chemotaxis protein [Methanohalophilus levihalophilus]